MNIKETIILTELNGSELKKSLAINNTGSFNTRILSGVKLAKEAMLRNGITVNKKEISSLRQKCIIYRLLNDIEYFKGSTFEDAGHILKSLTEARLLCRGNEDEKMKEVFSDGEFKEKNEAVYKVYTEYKKVLKDNNWTDSIETVNMAIINKCVMDAEYVILKEDPLMPLYEELLKTVSEGKYEEKTIREFAGLKDKKLSGITYSDAYGAINEVEHILGYIGENKIRYEDCVIALIDPSYKSHLLSYRDAYEIPVSFDNGINISFSNAYKLLDLIKRWNDSYNSTDGLMALINAPEFDTEKFWNNISESPLKYRDKYEVLKTVGFLRLSVNKDNRLTEYRDSIAKKEEKELYPYVEKIAQELYKGYGYLVSTYTKDAETAFEERAISKIVSYLDEYKECMGNESLYDILTDISSMSVSRQLSKSSTIIITNLKGALTSIRKHLFICGLNAKVFPGSPSEDYLLLDSDLERFNEESARNSNKKISINKKLLNDVLDNAAAFNEQIHLSYSGYSLSDLKSENPSSVLFEVFKKENGEKSTTKEFRKALGEQIHYFDEKVSSMRNIGIKYLEGSNLSVKEKEDDEFTETIMSRTISPSSAEVFFECPKRFFLSKILGINEPDEDDPFKSLPANDEGTLIHECMEEYGYHPEWTREEFEDNARRKIEGYFKKRIPIHLKNMNIIKDTFMTMAMEGYDSDPHNRVYKSEAYLGPYKEPITGLRFGGIVDRIEELDDGTYLIVDYKTYKDVRNETDDIETCFQVVLYAYLLEQLEGKKVKRCEYRYLRNPRTITCEYDDVMKESLERKLNDIKSVLDEGVFECASDDEICKYCKLKSICGRKVKEK